MRRPPLLGRILALLLTGDDGDVVRGDIEEAYLRRIGDAPPVLRHQFAYYADLLKSVIFAFDSWIRASSPIV